MSALTAFEDYLIKEFQLESLSSTDIKYTHALKTNLDKKSKTKLNNHVISISVTCYDKHHNELNRFTFKFVNNELPKTIKQKFVNISPDELTNLFNAAKREIVNKIASELHEKQDEIIEKLSNLLLYEKVKDNDVIKSEMKGELVQVTAESKKSVKFDM